MMDVMREPWFFALEVVVALVVLFKVIAGDPFKFVGHTLYLSGTLGSGKTRYAAMLVRLFLKKGKKVYATYYQKGAIPFDISRDDWPQDEGCLIILDEMLALRKMKFYDEGVLADGLAFARQKNQTVLILSQSHLSELGDLKGTIQTFAITKGLNLRAFGAINLMFFSSSAFKDVFGLKSPGAKRQIVYVPPTIFREYQSKRVYGFTVEKDNTDIPREQLEARRIQREARHQLRKRLAKQLVDEEIRRIQAGGAAHVTGDQREPGAAYEPPPAPARKPRVHRVKRRANIQQ